jgi:hypothetical protein
MENNIYCVNNNEVITIDEDNKILSHDLSCKNNETIVEENNLCYDDCHYEICSIDYKETNTKKIKFTYEETNEYDINNKLLDEIREYAAKINYKDFHGKGTIEDYSKLFEAVSKMANDYKKAELDFETEGFNDFSHTAEEMINVFELYSKKIQNINIINDTHFLISISNSLEKMIKLSDAFIKFNKTVLSISDIHIPEKVCETTQILSDAMVDITCAVNYISHFINPNNINNPLLYSELNKEDKNTIDNAVNIITNMNLNYNDIKNRLENEQVCKDIIKYNKSIRKSSDILKNATTNFKNKINNYTFN